MQPQMMEGFRLSPQQKRVWTLKQETSAYRAQCAIQLRGALKTQVLKQALQMVSARQEFCARPFSVSRESGHPFSRSQTIRQLLGATSIYQGMRLMTGTQEFRKCLRKGRKTLSTWLSALSQRKNTFSSSVCQLCVPINGRSTVGGRD